MPLWKTAGLWILLSVRKALRPVNCRCPPLWNDIAVTCPQLCIHLCTTCGSSAVEARWAAHERDRGRPTDGVTLVGAPRESCPSHRHIEAPPATLHL